MRVLDVTGGLGELVRAEMAGQGTVIMLATIGTPGTYNTSTGVPTNGIPGYSKGALFINPLGSAGSLLYVNQGTSTSSSWASVA